MVDTEWKVKGRRFSFLTSGQMSVDEHSWTFSWSPLFCLYILSICRMFIKLSKKAAHNWNNSTLFLPFVFSSKLTATHLPPSHPILCVPSHHVTSGSANLPCCVFCVLHPNEGGIRLIEAHIFPRGAEGDEKRAKWGVNAWSLQALRSKSQLMSRGILLMCNIVNIQSNQSDERVGVWKRSQFANLVQARAKQNQPKYYKHTI